MHRGALLAALTALGAATLAFCATLPDTVGSTSAVYARRGSLGANDYVATNVAPCKSAYQIVRVADGRLRDRAVNIATVAGDAEFALPSRRTVAGFARSFVLHLSVASNVTCSVAFTGADALYKSTGSEGLTALRGRYLITLLEVADNRYLVDVHELEEIRR